MPSSDGFEQVRGAVANQLGDEWWEPVSGRWWLSIVVVGVVSHGIVLGRLLNSLGPGTRPPLRDSIIFEYIGWYLTVGGRLYLDVWEIKPPLAFEIPALVTILAGGNVVLAHWLSVAVTVAFAIGGAVLVGALVVELTGDRSAAVLGGIALYTFPVYAWRTAFGFKVKYVVIFAGLLAIWLVLRDRFLVAGVSAGAAVGVWQLAVIFPALTVGLAMQRGGTTAVRRGIIGLAGSSAVILAPVVLWGAVPAMVVETVFTPLLVTEGGTMLSRLHLAARMFGPVVPLVLLGAVGLVSMTVRSRRHDGWWAPVLGAWFTVQILALDLDYYPDLIPFYAVVALGLGLLAGTDRIGTVPLGVVVAALTLSAVVTLGGFTAGPALAQPEPVQAPGDVDASPPYSSEERRALFWQTRTPETCRVFYGGTQARLIEATGGAATQDTCGKFEPAWRALASKYGLPG